MSATKQAKRIAAPSLRSLYVVVTIDAKGKESVVYGPVSRADAVKYAVGLISAEQVAEVRRCRITVTDVAVPLAEVVAAEKDSRRRALEYLGGESSANRKAYAPADAWYHERFTKTINAIRGKQCGRRFPRLSRTA